MAKIQYARVNERKEIILPPHIAQELGLTPGDKIQIEPNSHGLYLHPSIHTLKRVYVEVTNKCNLTCSTCMRNVWDANYGQMTDETFERTLSGFGDSPGEPELFFGGYGEPLSHPKLIEWVARAKKQGHRVSLITNGTLLAESISKRLIEVGLDMLWVSLDGASPECYTDVRLGDSLPLVLENLARFRTQKHQIFGPWKWSGNPKLGIAFVAMRRNIHDLNEVIHLGTRLGAVEFSITNVLAHNTELLDENLYMRSMDMLVGQEVRPMVRMPFMDIQPQTIQAFIGVLKEMNRFELSGGLLNHNIDQCPFVERGSVSIRWDGKVSPCLPLLYTHTYFLDHRERTSREYFVGDIHEDSLTGIWNNKTYQELRNRLQDFDFSPCAFCNSCEMANENMEDCFGNVQPTCGGCLWARGLIRCP